MKVLSGVKGIVAGFRPKQGIRDLIGAGYKYLCLDLGLFCESREIETVGKIIKSNAPGAVRDKITEHPELMLEYPKTLIDSVIQSGLSFELGVAPIHPYKEDTTDHSELLLNLTVSAVKLCKMAGCKYLIVHPIAREQGERDRITAWYERLISAAKDNGVTILIPNEAKYYEGHWVRGLFADPGELSDWIDMMNEKAGDKTFAVCLDVGNANLCGQDIFEMVRTLSSRIVAIEMRENNGRDEADMLPFSNVYSKPDYMGLIRGLREIDFDGLLWMNSAGTFSSFSTLLRPPLIQLTKEVGDYFAWQIGMEKGLKKYSNRVLFGAGNMCRNYMKCYGEQYPPLFTCDNNSSLWDTKFCGLTIKNPEELKSIPEDCVIYICNTYYREIDEQLREMGIENPIEYFNDEYLPSYHTNRIARKSDA